MAQKNYSSDLVLLQINGRTINDWGVSNEPISHSTIDQATVLERGMGGTAVRFDRNNPGEALAVAVQVGSPDSAYLQGLKNSRANITASLMVVGTLETFIATEGVFVNSGPTGRGGMSATDDIYNFEFNGFSETKGGAQ